MIEGDYTKKKISINKKNKSLENVIKSENNIEYVLPDENQDSLGRGGAGRVRTVIRASDGKEMAFKEFIIKPDNQTFISNLKENIIKLIDHPIISRNKDINESIILPLDLIELKASKSFGYIMEKVDTSKYISLTRLGKSEFIPDAKILATIGRNIALVFHEIHSQKGGYKDINEGNILINFENGSIRLIDCENISEKNYEVIFGTVGFVAPEVFESNLPDFRSDQHSMAVFFFKLLMGGHPLIGEKAIEYMRSNGLYEGDAASVIYGKDSLFIFDENDSSNSITSLVKSDASFRNIFFRWTFLPPIIKECFHETFSKGLHKKELRTIDIKWASRFSKILNSGLVKCPNCGKYNFKDSEIKNSCFYCKTSFNVQTEEAIPKALPKFRFKAKLKDKTGILEVFLRNPVSGSDFGVTLPDYAFIITNDENESYYIANPSRYNIEITNNNKKIIIKPNERYPLKDNMNISIFGGDLSLTYLGQI